MPPKLMGYEGRAVVIDPDIFAATDVWELLNRDMQGKAILCRMRSGTKGLVDRCNATSVMLLDCAKLTHWDAEQGFREMFEFERDYQPWIGLKLEDRETIGFDMVCFINVSLQLHQFEAIERFKELVQDMPEVLECHHITGQFDYLLKVVCRNHRELETFLVERLTPTPGVDRIRTSIVLREVKHSTALPLSTDSTIAPLRPRAE